MERINQRDIENMLSRINQSAGFANPKYNMKGAYCLDYAYGGVELQQYVGENGGIRSVTHGHDTKRILHGKMTAFLAGLDRS